MEHEAIKVMSVEPRFQDEVFVRQSHGSNVDVIEGVGAVQKEL